MHSAYHSSLSSQGLHEAELQSSTPIPDFHTYYMCSSALDGEFAIMTTIAQQNATVSDIPVHSMGRELGLKTGFFFQT